MTYSFVNPYNFVPLSKKDPERFERKPEAESVTGVIEYSILTKTPLMIPNTSNSDAFGYGITDHKSYDFFSYNDLSGKTLKEDEFFEPVIPGSEMRGMIRNYYEILTNSCMSSLDSDSIMNKRVAEPFKAGLLKKNIDANNIVSYDLYMAKDYLFRAARENCLDDANNSPNLKVKSYIQKSLKEGQKITFDELITPGVQNTKKVKPKAGNLNKGNMEGYVIKGEKGPTKHNLHIFALDVNSSYKNDVKTAILDQVLEAYKNSSKSYVEYRTEYKNFKENAEDGTYFPVYYSEIVETKAFFLSPACITKEVYQRKLADLVGSHNTCSNKNELCPACRLFGTVIQKGENAGVASKIRFSDMKLAGDKSADSLRKIYMKPVTLAPLSSPKLNNMEFYLKKPAPNAVFWTYDYYMDTEGSIKVNNAGINGRKFYWHNMNPYLAGNINKEKQNTTVRPLKNGVKFTGKLYFEGISKDNLNKLIYILNAGDAADLISKEHGYKLGGAKPLGFGSIAINVDSVKIRTITKLNNAISYQENDYAPKNAEFDPNIQNNFVKMTDFNILKDKNVDYPRISPRGDIFGWFVSNHDPSRTEKIKRNRSDEGFNEYMEPMVPELKKNAPKTVKQGKASSVYSSGYGKNNGNGYGNGYGSNSGKVKGNNRHNSNGGKKR